MNSLSSPKSYVLYQKKQESIAKSQFDISVGAVNNIMKRKREYENLGERFG